MRPKAVSKLPPSVAGEIGRLLASAEMLKRGICVSRPEVDTGVDLVSHFGRETRLIQVKAKVRSNRDAFRHCTGDVFNCAGGWHRRRDKRRSVAVRESSSQYGRMGVDAFVFVRLVGELAFWVVPTHCVKSQWVVTLREDSEWRDAWHILTEKRTNAA